LEGSIEETRSGQLSRHGKGVSTGNGPEQGLKGKCKDKSIPKENEKKKKGKKKKINNFIFCG